MNPTNPAHDILFSVLTIKNKDIPNFTAHTFQDMSYAMQTLLIDIYKILWFTFQMCPMNGDYTKGCKNYKIL